jgi:hypothetical protein
LLGDQMEEVLMAVTFNNSVFDANQSQVGVTALGLFAGSDALSGTTAVTVNGTIDQPGSTVALTLNVAGVTQTGVPGTYIGYTTDQNSNVVYYFNADVANVQVPVVTVAVTGSPVLPTLGATPINTTATAAPVCFAAGTQILTPRGEVTVETLEIGDEVVTASGAHRPITWIGHRDMALERQSAAQPIRIKAGAVAPACRMPICSSPPATGSSSTMCWSARPIWSTAARSCASRWRPCPTGTSSWKRMTC